MADDLTVGAVIAGRYRLERLVAEGGMGVVWAAKHLVTRKPVALKFVKGEAADDDLTRRRLLREARAACAVQHPNVVAVHDVMELESGSPVLVMDLLKGESLRAKLDREGRIPLHDLANIMTPVISAVGTAHASGVVHRDLKPENIYLADMPGGVVQVKVLDFGIAKLTSTEGIMAQSSVLTGTGLLLGTPDYMSLEQILGEEDVDHRADIWALGIVLYECLDGRRPTAADNVGKVLKIILTNAIPPISQVLPGLPEEIKALITKMLTLDRNGRPDNLQEVGRVLERYATVPLLPFDLPRARPLSELPPGPVQPLPSTVIGSPRPPRAGQAGQPEPARTLLPGGKPPPPPRPGASAKAPAPDRRPAAPKTSELAETQAAPLQPARPSAGSHAQIIPPQPGRDAGESGMSIALDEPFAESASREPTATSSKSLTLGDLLSPDELAMLGERLERAQSNAPSSAPTSGSDVMIPPGIPVSQEMAALAGGATAKAAEAAADASPPPSEIEPPISSSEILPASSRGELPSLEPDDDPISSGRAITLVEQRPIEQRPTEQRPNEQRPAPAKNPYAAGYLTPDTLPENIDLSDTLPVPLRTDGTPPPPTLPFVPAAGARRPHGAAQQRLSFADAGGSTSFPRPRLSYSDSSGATVLSQQPPPRGPVRSTEVQTPHTSTSSNPSWTRPPSSRRGKVWAVLGGLGLALLAGWWAFGPTSSPGNADRPLDTALVAPPPPAAPPPPTCPEGMALVPGEMFAMGSDGPQDERPVHPVTVQSFCLDLTEVTGNAYLRCVEAGSCEQPSRTVSASSGSKSPLSAADRTFESRFCQDPRRDAPKNHPINCVSWAEASNYCRVQGKRLPTEEEWEFAARGGTELRLYPWGAAAPSAKLLNACGKECENLYEQLGRKGKSTLFADSDGQGSLAPVGSFPAGDARYGAHDMAGNLWEWTASAYCKYPSHSCSNGDRVFRGGSWASSSAQSFTGTRRMWGAPESRYMDVGFRCAKDRG